VVFGVKRRGVGADPLPAPLAAGVMVAGRGPRPGEVAGGRMGRLKTRGDLARVVGLPFGRSEDDGERSIGAAFAAFALAGGEGAARGDLGGRGALHAAMLRAITARATGARGRRGLSVIAGRLSNSAAGAASG
jgi:hypothetical protein